jgi:hypothetical protein
MIFILILILILIFIFSVNNTLALSGCVDGTICPAPCTVLNYYPLS